MQYDVVKSGHINILFYMVDCFHLYCVMTICHEVALK